jgi:surface polysaccharide O-acyltransferase-like enzyme
MVVVKDSGCTHMSWAENIFDSLTRWGVPIFLMVSGMLMLNTDKNESLKTFFLKRVNKILIPFLVWGIIFDALHPRYMNVPFSLKGLFTDFISGIIYWHFWFMYAIVGLYILTPVIRVFVNYASKNIMIYALTLWFTFASVIPLIENIFHINFDGSTNMSVMGNYLGYFVLGHFLHTYEVSKLFKRTVYFLALVSAIISPTLTYILTRNNNGNFMSYFYDYQSITVVIMSVAVFIFIKSIDWDSLLNDKAQLNSAISVISHASFGVFLVHFIFMNELGRFGIELFTMGANSWLRVPVMDIIVFSLSLLFVIVLRKIPYIRRIV